MISHVLSVIPRKEPKERNEAMKEDKDEVWGWWLRLRIPFSPFCSHLFNHYTLTHVLSFFLFLFHLLWSLIHISESCLFVTPLRWSENSLHSQLGFSPLQVFFFGESFFSSFSCDVSFFESNIVFTAYCVLIHDDWKYDFRIHSISYVMTQEESV
jgi:hypothetical protein